MTALGISVGTTGLAISGALTGGPGERLETLRAPRGSDGAKSAVPDRGDALPPSDLPDADGRVWTSSDSAGKVVLPNFWATWRGPCRTGMPWFKQFQHEYRDSGFSVAAVSVDREGWGAVLPYVEELDPNDPVLLSQPSVNQTFFGDRIGLPATYVVRMDGTIHSRHVGSRPKSHFSRAIEDALAGPSDIS